MAELRIPLIVENKGKKALGDVDKGIKGISKSFTKLAGAAGIGLSTAAIISFGKAGVKAFAENEKSARRLAGVVKNLGLSLETPLIEASLDRISAKYGLQGEVLREAYQKLITATGSLEKSQLLLQLSLDVAAGSGQDLLSVNQDLAALYVGNTKGLKKYNLGLSNSQLKTIKFEDAVSLLNKTFKGASAAELETYSGKMRVLGEAADNAQEIIGGGLINALMILSGDTTVEDLAVSMADLATNTAAALENLGKFGKGVQDTVGPIATVLEKFINATQPIFNSIVFGDALFGNPKKKATAGRFFAGGQDSILEAKRNKERAAAEAAALKAARDRAALENKTLQALKKKAALDKASKTLNLDLISIEAALKGQISETDRLSLKLQRALLDDNDSAATKLSGQLEAAVKRQNELSAALLATPEAPNPFRNWKVPALDFGGNLLGSVVPNFVPPAYAMPETFGQQGGLPAGVVAGVNPTPPISIVVELDGAVVGGAIRETSINDSLSGSFNTVNRTSRFAPDGFIPA